MPNWTENELTLRGSAKTLQRVIDECCSDEVGGVINFAKIIPYPEGFDPSLTSGSEDEAYELYYKPDAVRPYLRSSMFADRIKKHGSLEALRAHEEARYLERAQATLARAEAGSDAPWDQAEARKYKQYPTLRDLADAYKRNIETGGSKTWYDWNTNNWGTKWNACDGYREGSPEEQELRMRFNTAWADPVPVFEALRNKYPTLDIEYVARHEGDDEITGRRWYAEEEETP